MAKKKTKKGKSKEETKPEENKAEEEINFKEEIKPDEDIESKKEIKPKEDIESEAGFFTKFWSKPGSKKIIIIGGIVLLLMVLAIVFNLNRADKSNSAVITNLNGEEVSTEELDKRYEFFFFLVGYPEEYKQIVTKESFVDQLINEKLLLQEAAKKNIIITDKEVDAEIDNLVKQSPVSYEELEEQLKENDFSMDYLTEYYKNQMILTKLLDTTVFLEMDVTEPEISEYYNENKELYFAEEGQIRARHILVETEEEAEDIKRELDNGRDFAELAEEKSIGPSGPNGGELGFFEKGQMVQGFEEMAFSLKVNEISEPVKTDFGWHIIQRGEDTISLNEARESIEEVLLIEKQRQALDDYV
ncbi:unnamed protein product, partial [marine sediment metagenome]